MGPNLHRVLLYLWRQKNGSSAIKENCVGREHLESSEIWWSYCQIKLSVLSCNGKLNGGELQFLPVLRGYLLGDFYEANTEDNIKGNLLKKIIISLLRSTKKINASHKNHFDPLWPLAFFLSNIKSLKVLKEKKTNTNHWCSHSGRKDYQAYYLAALWIVMPRD